MYSVTLSVTLCHAALLLSLVTNGHGEVGGEPSHKNGAARSSRGISKGPDQPDSAVAALTGSDVSLPCSITGGTVYAVLWYRAPEGEPLYTFDGRSSSQEHWSSEPPDGFGRRAVFHTDTRPASLLIHKVRLEETGIYRCRVDFKANQTQNYYVNLTVILPPEKPRISWDLQQPEEAFREGGNLRMQCVVESGAPTPQLVWTLNKDEENVEKLKGSPCPNRPNKAVVTVTTSQSGDSTLVSHLESVCVPRSWAGARLGCKATNNNISDPAYTELSLKVYVRPVSVSVTGPGLGQLSAGKYYRVTCTSWGSSPPATLSWSMAGRNVGRVPQQVSADGNTSTSVLEITPHYKDYGKNLTCRAENEELSPKFALEKSVKMNVLFPPRITLSFGANIDPANIIEGNDVYFECHIEANPTVYKVEWKKNGGRVEQDLESGVLVSNTALVLQKVRQSMAGLYTCTASNIEGDTVSNTLQLQIDYKPVCVGNTEVTIGVSGRKAHTINCQSRSYPEPNTYRWVLNTTHNMETLHQTEGSVTIYKNMLGVGEGPGTSLGVLECWPSNTVGEANIPCTYLLVEAGLPDPPDDCRVTNETNESLSVICRPGWSGGLRQTFHLELWDTGKTHKLLRNITRNIGQPPHFDLANLLPGKRLIIKIYSANDKGRSERTVELESSTSKVAELQIDTAVPDTMTPRTILVALVSSSILVLVSCCTAGLAAQWWRSRAEVREVREAGREGRECMELHPSPQQCRDREEGGVITQCSERTAPQTEHVKDMFVSSESEEVPCYADSRFRETFISSADPTGWNGLGCESGDRRTLLPPDRESLHRNTDRESLHRTNRHGQGFQARTNIQLNPTFDSSYQC